MTTNYGDYARYVELARARLSVATKINDSRALTVGVGEIFWRVVQLTCNENKERQTNRAVVRVSVVAAARASY